MFEEEQRLGKGSSISDAKDLDRILLGTTKPVGKRPLSAYNAKSNYESNR